MGKSVEPKRPNFSALKDGAISLGESIYWKPSEGPNILRVLPGWDPEDELGRFFYDQILHYGFENAEGNETTIPCFELEDGDCPVCKVVQWLRVNGKASQEKLQRRIRPTVNVYFNIIPRELETPRVMLWRCSPSNRDKMLDLLNTEDYGDSLGLEEGRDWTLTRKGVGMRTKYPTLIPAPRLTPTGIDDVMSQIYNIPREVGSTITKEQAEEMLFLNLDGQVPLEEILV